MRISDWSSDVCSSDLVLLTLEQAQTKARAVAAGHRGTLRIALAGDRRADAADEDGAATGQAARPAIAIADGDRRHPAVTRRDEVMAIADPRAGRNLAKLSNPRRQLDDGAHRVRRRGEGIGAIEADARTHEVEAACGGGQGGG